MITSTKSFIYMKYEESFLIKKFISVLQQKNLIVTQLNKKYLPHLSLDLHQTSLIINYEHQKKIKFSTPLRFQELFSNFSSLLSSYSLEFKGLNYFPYGKKIYFDALDINLNETHNIIFSNMLLCQEEGVSKLDLYKFIWPNDKDISINKLDTHLTNLKNYLFSELNFSLNFTTLKGLLILV
jgi:hypothetical protein